MIEEKVPISDLRDLDRKVGVLLRTGMLSSAAIILFGGALFLLHHGKEVPNYHAFHGVPAELRSISGIVSEAFAGHALAIIQLGLLLLIATPVARVIFSAFRFAFERDCLYMTIALIVLAMLLYSLLVHLNFMVVEASANDRHRNIWLPTEPLL